MFRKALFASLIALGAASAGTAAQAQPVDDGPRLVNRNGSQEVVYGAQPRDNVVGGAFATVTGGSDYPEYTAQPGGRTEPVGPAARLVGGGENAQVVYGAPPAAAAPSARAATAARSPLSPRG